MAFDHIKNVKISAICCAVPEDKLALEDFYKKFDKESVERFVKDTGIKQKFYSKNNKTITSDLCFAAAEEIIKKKNISRDEIDAVILVTQSPDYTVPATAITLQYRLGLSQECIAYDINLGCSGYIFGLHTAASMLQSGYLKKVLLLAGDVTEPSIFGINGVTTNMFGDLNDLLFGDCGSATLIEYDEGNEGFRFALQSMGDGFKAIGACHGSRYAYVGRPQFDMSLHMDGLAVVSFSITKVPRLFKAFFEKFQASAEEYDSVLLHQANKSMLDTIAKKIKMQDKSRLSLERYANTSSASVPNAMCDYYGDKDGDESVKVIMSGFGIGLSLGVADAYISPKDILPIIQTDITWDEGRSKVLEANAKSKK